jgi:hypothetical protein
MRAPWLRCRIPDEPGAAEESVAAERSEAAGESIEPGGTPAEPDLGSSTVPPPVRSPFGHPTF